jgi:hypothetical protein
MKFCNISLKICSTKSISKFLESIKYLESRIFGKILHNFIKILQNFSKVKYFGELLYPPYLPPAFSCIPVKHQHRASKPPGHTIKERFKVSVQYSVAEPELESEPVEQQLFAGAKVFWPGSGAGYVNSYKTLNFSY